MCHKLYRITFVTSWTEPMGWTFTDPDAVHKGVQIVLTEARQDKVWICVFLTMSL